jgi:hypothetical protein
MNKQGVNKMLKKAACLESKTRQYANEWKSIKKRMSLSSGHAVDLSPMMDAEYSGRRAACPILISGAPLSRGLPSAISAVYLQGNPSMVILMADGRGEGEEGVEVLIVVGVEVSSGRQCHVYMPYEVNSSQQPVFSCEDVDVYPRENIPRGVIPRLLAEFVV